MVNKTMVGAHMKRIAFFSGDITGNGGTERVATVIADTLAARGIYQLFFVSLAQEREQTTFPLSENIPRTALTGQRIKPGVGYLPLIFRLKKYVETNQIDLLIDIDGVLDVLSLPVKWMTGVRIISWEHFYYYDARGTWYRRPIRRLSVHFADAVVTLTEQDRSYYLENGISEKKVHTIHNPMYELSDVQESVNYVGYDKGDPEPLQNGGETKHTKKVIFSAGALSQIKGFWQVPLIAKKLKALNPELEFVWNIAGEGVLREEIEHEIIACNVQEQVHLLGQSNRMRTLYEQSDLFVMTSEREGMPMVLLEAKQCGLPIISYDIRTGPAEIISDGINGYLVAYTKDPDVNTSAMAHAIEKLLSNEKLYCSFAEHTKEQAEDFRLDAIADQWEALIESLFH